MTVVEDFDGQSPDEEDHYFGPESIRLMMRRLGIHVSGAEKLEPEEEQAQEEPDLEVQIVDRVLRYFQRSTSINEHTFAKRLGHRYRTFEDTVLPELLDMEVLREVPYTGAGSQRRFRLSASFQTVEQARQRSRGSYERLKEALRKGETV